MSEHWHSLHSGLPETETTGWSSREKAGAILEQWVAVGRGMGMRINAGGFGIRVTDAAGLSDVLTLARCDRAGCTVNE